MTILVSDTSVLIDLERGGLIRQCFGLPFGFAVPDLLYEHELAEYGGPDLLQCGLKIVELDPDEVTLAQQVRTERPRLSVADAYAYSLASKRSWTLLSGDGELRDLASRNKVPCKGVLWVADQMFEIGVVEVRSLVRGIETIAAHPRCRLPGSEITIRIERYTSAVTTSPPAGDEASV